MYEGGFRTVFWIYVGGVSGRCVKRCRRGKLDSFVEICTCRRGKLGHSVKAGERGKLDCFVRDVAGKVTPCVKKCENSKLDRFV